MAERKLDLQPLAAGMAMCALVRQAASAGAGLAAHGGVQMFNF
jgi:hypothetical protein